MKKWIFWGFNLCIVIDVNCFSTVFNKNSKNHDRYLPVFNWIHSGNGKLVYGGSKYLEEIRHSNACRRILVQYEKMGKTVLLNKERVDENTEIVKMLENDPDFDDPHILGIIRFSKCKLVCSEDKRSFKFIKDVKFYEHNKHKPRIYTGLKNANLLSDRNICEVCKK